MNPVEDRLRDALREKAETFTPDPDAKARVLRRVRRRRGRDIAACAAAVAAIVAGAVFALPQDEGAAKKPVLRPEDSEAQRDLVKPLLAQYPPLGPVTRIQPDQGADGVTMHVWLATKNGETAFCHGIPTEGGCGTLALPKGEHAARSGKLDPREGLDVIYGLADERVASMSVRLTDGSRRPGTVREVPGIPHRVWQAGVPDERRIKSLDFADRSGGNVERITPPPSFDCGGGTAAGPNAVTLGGTVTAEWQGGCVNFRAGPLPIGSLPDGGSLATMAGRFGGPLVMSQGYWAGVAPPSTARVELRYPDGKRVRGWVARPRWSGGRVAVHAGEFRAGKNTRDAWLTGYSSSGRVIWRLPML
ncbi:hypothetical protein [Spirillospora sp. CA-294931]|uniref:hypothetical protein n=1 Tax=Spirillospora sp. CA-294931 TaxID=3240042 RepID=UPI003D90DB3A